MYLALGRADDALRHAKRQMKANEMEKLFISFAKKSEKKATTRPVAEKIYIALQKPDRSLQLKCTLPQVIRRALCA
jgi:hypothetical protein